MSHNSTEYHLFDDPESQIRFLEVALGKQEWRARILVPHFQARASNAADLLKQKLEAKGYLVRRERDASGHDMLLVHHTGAAPNMLALFRQHGLIKGAGYSITHPLISLGKLLDTVHDAANLSVQTLKDPARANGVIFMTAEAFLLAAAGGNPHGKWYEPKNLLQGIAASCYLSQSFAYMFWAKKGDDRIASDYASQLSDAIDTDRFDEISDASALNKRPTRHLIDAARRVLEDHPIQTGAMLNNAGMFAYLGHAILERQHRLGILKHTPHDAASLTYVQKGFARGVASTIISIIGWSALLVTPKESDHKATDPLSRLLDKLRENPQALTGFTSITSSSLRLAESISKGNRIQAIGESIYIPGDILLFFVKNHDYGASRHGDYKALASKVAQVVLAAPALISPARQEDLYSHTAAYMIKQHSALSGNHTAGKADAAQIQALTSALREQCQPLLTQRFHRMIEESAQLVRLFPKDQQAALAIALSQTLPALKGIAAQESDITQALNNALQQIALTPAAAGKEASSPAPLSRIASQIGRISLSIPSEHAAENALKLYQSVMQGIQVKSDNPLDKHQENAPAAWQNKLQVAAAVTPVR